MSSRRIWTCIGALMLLAGCAGDDGASAPEERQRSIRDAGTLGPSGGNCSADEDCLSGQTCMNGSCSEDEIVVPTICSDDAGCPAGNRCVDGRCEPGDRPCMADVDCPPGQTCMNGACGAGMSTGCMNDGECGVGQRCVNGECVVDGGGCTSEGDCPAGQSCINGRCEAQQMAQCGADRDCPVGMVCRNGACIPDPAAGGCNNNAECGAGMLCQNGQCIPDPNAGRCMNDAECGLGLSCVNGECVPQGGGAQCNNNADCLSELLVCQQGMCVPIEGLGDACLDDSDCRANMTCVPIIGCFPLGNGPPPADECRNDGDCPGGMRCDAGSCVEEEPLCALDADCPAGMRCDGGFCVPGNGGGDLCMGDADCPAGMRCEAGACVGGGDACADDGDCPGEGEICFNGECQAPGVMCVDDLDCGGGDMQCVNGRCEIRCRDDADCNLIGQVCRNERCVDDDAGMDMAADACDAPMPIALDTPVRGSTAGLGSNHGARCGSLAASPEVAYLFRPVVAGPVCVTTAQSSFDTVLHIREAACGDDRAEIACNDDESGEFGIARDGNSTLELNAEANTAYYLFVDGYGANNSGDYVVEVRNNACDGPWGDGPAACLAPAQIAPGQLVRGHTDGGNDTHQGSCAGNGPESVFLVSVPFAGQLCASTVGSSFDTVLYVREARCGDGMELACNDDINIANRESLLSFAAEVNTDYYLFVDSFGLGGNFQLELTEGACQ